MAGDSPKELYLALHEAQWRHLLAVLSDDRNASRSAQQDVGAISSRLAASLVVGQRLEIPRDAPEIMQEFGGAKQKFRRHSITGELDGTDDMRAGVTARLSSVAIDRMCWGLPHAIDGSSVCFFGRFRPQLPDDLYGIELDQERRKYIDNLWEFAAVRCSTVVSVVGTPAVRVRRGAGVSWKRAAEDLLAGKTDVRLVVRECEIGMSDVLAKVPNEDRSTVAEQLAAVPIDALSIFRQRGLERIATELGPTSAAIDGYLRAASAECRSTTRGLEVPESLSAILTADLSAGLAG